MPSLAIISDRANSIEMTIQVISLCRALNDACQKCLNIIRNEIWARSCFNVVRYNIMISSSVESVNALSRDTQKLPMKMLIDFF
uniref:Uncharacterized protein n=1 Tax=Lactuca sativa TaxID=4236 RepID=A0A9R1WWF7_LACSA|nr:hypothetical protein LSAT_V11C800406540 [Lactuca sativa]